MGGVCRYWDNGDGLGDNGCTEMFGSWQLTEQREVCILETVEQIDIILSSYKEKTLNMFPKFTFTWSGGDYVDPCGRVVLYPPTVFLSSSSQNHTLSAIPFECGVCSSRLLIM